MPPWNRIGERVASHVNEIGFQAISGFGWANPGDKQIWVNTHVDISQLTTWTAGFDDIQSYRLNAETAATIYLDNSHHFYIKSGIRHDYDSKPLDDVEPLDTYYFTNLGYEF